MIYMIVGFAAAAVFVMASIFMFIMGFGAVINHVGRSEQDDNET